MFADRLFALLLQYGIDLRRMQERCGVYLKSYFLITDYADYVGSIELANEYLKALPPLQKEESDTRPNNGDVGAFKLPTELDTAEAREVFQKAIEAGLMSKTASGYKWEKSNVLLAFMCGVLYCGDTVVSSSLYRDVKKDTVNLNKQNEFTVCSSRFVLPHDLYIYSWSH